MSSKIHQKVSPEIISLVFGVFVLCFVLGFWVLAWTDPTADPPTGNVDAPLNVGPTGQTKGGGLILNQDKNTYGLIIDGDAGNANGKVGIGILLPGTKLDVAGDIRLGAGAATYKVMNVADPTSDTDVATKGYVDDQWAPSDVIRTTNYHKGDFVSGCSLENGYECMNEWIQTNGCAGYHVCDGIELTRWMQLGNAIGGGWYISGGSNEDNCYGWTDSSADKYGAKAGYSSPPAPYIALLYRRACIYNNYVACCK